MTRFATYAALIAGCLAFSAGAFALAVSKDQASPPEQALESNGNRGSADHYGARLAKANADYRLATEACGGLSDSAKAPCVRQAKADRSHAKGDARSQMRIARATQDVETRLRSTNN
jgi:hypothetical protein